MTNKGEKVFHEYFSSAFFWSAHLHLHLAVPETNIGVGLYPADHEIRRGNLTF
jgi:hypothetical protein